MHYCSSDDFLNVTITQEWLQMSVAHSITLLEEKWFMNRTLFTNSLRRAQINSSATQADSRCWIITTLQQHHSERVSQRPALTFHTAGMNLGVSSAPAGISGHQRASAWHQWPSVPLSSALVYHRKHQRHTTLHTLIWKCMLNNNMKAYKHCYRSRIFNKNISVSQENAISVFAAKWHV